MTSLQKYINEQEQNIQQSLTEISELQKQLNELQQKLRISQQIHQAQKTAEVEVSKSLNQLKKLFKDICGIYPPEILDDLASEITNMAEEVKDNYQEYANSGRFLNGAEDDKDEEPTTLTDSKDYALIVESLPPEEDNETILTSSQVETIIRQKNETVHQFLKQQLGINGKVKRLPILAEKIADEQLTRKLLSEIIKAAELISKPLSLNGSTKHS
jgi:hypothetical protein